MPVLPNAKYERFAQGLADGMTADKAFIEAGFAANRGNAIRAKQRPDVQARVVELLGNAAERVEITKARVLEELGKIGFSDIRKLFEDDGRMKHITMLDDDTAGCVSSIEVIAQKVKRGEAEELAVENTVKIKLHDKRAALVDIGKHLGMFKEDTAPPALSIAIDDKELARLLVFQLTKASKEA